MNPSRFLALLPRLRAAAALAVLLAAPCALAAKKVVADVTANSRLKIVRNGNELTDLRDEDNLYDNDLASVGGVGEDNDFIVVSFGPLIAAAEPMMYVDEVRFDVPTNATATLRYSVYFSTDLAYAPNSEPLVSDVQSATWTPVVERVDVTAGASVTLGIKDRVKGIKFVPERNEYGNVQKELAEFHVTGYASSVPKNVVLNQSALAKMYKADGTDGSGGWGGGAGITWLFNGYKDTSGSAGWTRGGTWLPHLGNGGYCLIDFTSVMPGGYFVTAISISQCNAFKYSLYWSNDGATWNEVPDAIAVSKVGEAIYDVNETATWVKVLFNETGGWTENIAEIEVWGMTPDDVFCTHPAFTEWTAVEGTATCLTPGIDERFCSVCNKRFTRVQPAGLGHDFVSHLLVPGVYRKFGSGYVDCSRCDWRLDFPLDPISLFDTKPLDLVTNRVDGTQIGRVSVLGQFNFTEITVTSTGNGADEPDPNQNWGVNPSALINNNWGWGWKDYWYSIRPSMDPDPHVDYVFGTEIDLAWIDFSTDNGNYTNLFLSVDDDTGEEIPIAAVSAFTADETHQEEVEEIVFTRVYFSQTEDAEPVAGKTYYALSVVGEGASEQARWTPVSGLEAFEEGTDYFEVSATGAAWCTKTGDKYVQIATPDYFTSDQEYYAQSATTDGNYYTESSGKYVSAGPLTSFEVGTTYYRGTGVTTGDNLATIVDTHSDVTRMQLRFYRSLTPRPGFPVKHLRLRQIKTDGNVRAPMYVSELHPWGTVAGAGDLEYRKELLMIFR